MVDDQRVDDKDVVVLKVKGAYKSNISCAIAFCKSQIGKKYFLDFEKIYEIGMPEIKTITSATSSSMEITWDKVKKVTGYKIYRSENEKETYRCVEKQIMVKVMRVV